MDPPSVESRRKTLFAELASTHTLLTDYQEAHKKTGYGCVRSGQCCQVGLQLHMAECEYIAESLKEKPKELPARIRALEKAFQDDEWNWGSSIGERHCAFYDEGCTIYPVRPSICRMYGVVLQVDDFCPRERLSNGESFVYVQPDVDRMIARYYRTLDAYGRLFPKRDYTVFMPVGVLTFLVSAERLKALKEKTAPKFWKREKGYRTQYQQSYKAPKKIVTNVEFKFAIPKKA